MKVLVGITGASGITYALRLIEVLKEQGIETDCIASEASKKIAKHEGVESFDCYNMDDIEAAFASGSFELRTLAYLSLRK